MGCEQAGLPNPLNAGPQKEAEGKAIGSACRHAGRAIEDCYTLNLNASKAAIFAGWKEMNDYMLENKLAEVAPILPPPPSAEALQEKNKKKKTKKAAEEVSETEEPPPEEDKASVSKTADPAEDPPPRKRRRSTE